MPKFGKKEEIFCDNFLSVWFELLGILIFWCEWKYPLFFFPLWFPSLVQVVVQQKGVSVGGKHMLVIMWKKVWFGQLQRSIEKKELVSQCHKMTSFCLDKNTNCKYNIKHNYNLFLGFHKSLIVLHFVLWSLIIWMIFSHGLHEWLKLMPPLPPSPYHPTLTTNF